MARTQSIGIRKQLTSMIPARRLEALARKTGAVIRQRKVGIVPLFWALVLGFGTGKERSFAGLRRIYESMARQTLAPSAFWDRFNPALARFLKAVFRELVVAVSEPRTQLGGCLAGFKDLVLADATVIRLHDLLEKAYAACRTNHTKAAAKLHVVMSALGCGPHTVKITSERVGERERLQVGPWVKDRLLLFDLGYYRFQLFDCVRRNGGYFISRLKTHANPRIVAQNIRHRGRAVSLVGEHLQDVLPRLQRAVLDVQVEVGLRRRVYRGVRHGATTTFRLVGVFDVDTGKYHLYLTNIPPDRLSAQEVATTYRARWLVELAFAQLKDAYGLDQIPTRKKAAVEVFLYAALITYLAGQHLLRAVRRKLHSVADRITSARWARVVRAYAPLIVFLVVAPRRHARYFASAIEAVMLHEAVDPHLNRPGLLRQVENATSWNHAAALN